MIQSLFGIGLVGVCLVGWSSEARSAAGGERSAEQILNALDEVKIPSSDSARKDDSSSVRRYLDQLKETTEKRSALIWELFQVAPGHDRIPILMAERWSVRPYGLAGDRLQAEVADTLARTQNPGLKVEGEYASTYALLYDSPRDGVVNLSGVKRFREISPQDRRGATLLYLAARRTPDEQLKNLLEDQIIQEFPDSLPAEKIMGLRQKSVGLGKPFNLEFNDAIGGAAVSIRQLKGKVVVVAFWATWCAPCVADLPEMKRLYAKYHDQGVEFIGVSLDRPEARGGLKNLKKVVAEQRIIWPQYYQGEGWDSKFSSLYGINAIPAMFLIDAEGKLASTEAVGKLDVLIPELLAKEARPGKEK